MLVNAAVSHLRRAARRTTRSLIHGDLTAHRAASTSSLGLASACALLDEARLAAPMSPEVFASATKTMPVAVLDPASYLASGVVDMASPVLAAAPEMEVITRGAAPCLEGSGMIPFLAQLLDSAHTATGQPWWVIITSAVIAVRMVAIPLSIRGMAAGSRLRSVTPYMGLYRKQQEEAARRQDKQAIRAAMAQVSQLQKQYGTSFLTIASPIVLQMVMGIWMFTSLRRMGLEAEGIDGFLFEGLPWATDLSASEYTLPAIVTIAGLITAELSKSIAPKNPPPGSFNPDTMRNISRGFAVFGGAVMTTLPACVTLSAAVTAVSAVANLSLVQLPVVQKAFGFAKGWPDVEFVVPPGWDADAAQRLVKEYEAEQAKNNPMARLFGNSAASDKPGSDDSNNLQSGVVSFTGLQQQKPPPPPPVPGQAPSGESGNGAGPKLFKVRGERARKHTAKKHRVSGSASKGKSDGGKRRK